jgi:hypothetical protein
MKLSFAILLSFIAAIHGADDLVALNVLYNPEALFTRATEYQTKVTELQEDIVTVITSLRSQLSGILKETSNTTLSQVQDNIWTTFEMDAPIRGILFISNNQSTDCILNLRVQLNTVTEFSGYDSSNCLLRYNRNVTSLLASAYATLAEYEGQISIIQMLVVNSFNGYNIWINPEEIETKFTTDYNTHFAAWQIVKENITSFLSTLRQNINAHNVVLGSCFTGVQQGLTPQYNGIVARVDTCLEFDG